MDKFRILKTAATEAFKLIILGAFATAILTTIAKAYYVIIKLIWQLW